MFIVEAEKLLGAAMGQYLVSMKDIEGRNEGSSMVLLQWKGAGEVSR